MKKTKKILCLLFSASMIATLCSCTAQKAMIEPQPIPVNLSVNEKNQREMLTGDVFVSPNGNDENNGTESKPVHTIQRAIDIAEKIEKDKKVIFIKNGEYSINALELNEKSSGISFFAEDEAIFNGGVSLNPADFQDYKGKTKMLDLKKYGVTAEEIGNVKAFGQYNTAEKYDEAGSLYCELFYDNQRMTLARYPNAGENLKTGKIHDNGDSKEIYTQSGTQVIKEWDTMKNPRGGKFEAGSDTISRMKTWQNTSDVWMFGYFQYDWADSTTPLASFDDKSISTEYASVYGFKEGTPYYFFNVFEELDVENEWYIDKENQVLYFIPPEDYLSKPMQLSLETSNLITINGAKDITFDGITFCGTRASAIKGSGNNITVQNCTIKNVGENGIELEGNHITVQNNTITATGKGGVSLTGGDRNTLTSSENIVTNNLIHDWSQVYQTYQAAVALHGVGAVCSNNEIYNSPHEAITYTGNNHIIEYNVIHDVVLKSSDAGAIYAGRSWSACGTVIRYNCIYNIGSGEFKPSGIYFDDALSGQKAYGNLLVNIPSYGFLIGGGRNIEVENNIVVNAAVPFLYDDRAINGIENKGWFSHAKVPGEGLWATLTEVDVNSKTWQEAYPELSKLSSDFNDTKNPAFAANPSNSKVKNNVIVNPKKDIGDISKNAKKYSDISDNYLYKIKDKPFQKDGVYQLNEEISGFEQLPFEKMGRH